MDWRTFEMNQLFLVRRAGGCDVLGPASGCTSTLEEAGTSGVDELLRLNDLYHPEISDLFPLSLWTVSILGLDRELSILWFTCSYDKTAGTKAGADVNRLGPNEDSVCHGSASGVSWLEI
jgi:hypothetical protein